MAKKIEKVGKACRGLQCVSPAKRRRISRLGAQAVNAMGLGYRWDSAAAKAASRKGVRARRKNKTV